MSASLGVDDPERRNAGGIVWQPGEVDAPTRSARLSICATMRSASFAVRRVGFGDGGFQLAAFDVTDDSQARGGGDAQFLRQARRRRRDGFGPTLGELRPELERDDFLPGTKAKFFALDARRRPGKRAVPGDEDRRAR